MVRYTHRVAAKPHTPATPTQEEPIMIVTGLALYGTLIVLALSNGIVEPFENPMIHVFSLIYGVTLALADRRMRYRKIPDRRELIEKFPELEDAAAAAPKTRMLQVPGTGIHLMVNQVRNYHAVFRIDCDEVLNDVGPHGKTLSTGERIFIEHPKLVRTMHVPTMINIEEDGVSVLELPPPPAPRKNFLKTMRDVRAASRLEQSTAYGYATVEEVRQLTEQLRAASHHT